MMDGANPRSSDIAHISDKSAQFFVGQTYAYGYGGVPKSDTDAIYWFRRAGCIRPHVAEKGVDPVAPHALSVARAYAAGGCGGVEMDIIESLKWLKFAAGGFFLPIV